MRLEQITAQALKNVDNNRYLLSEAVAKRVKELSRGDKPLIEVKNSSEEPTNIALKEIAYGLIKVNLEN